MREGVGDAVALWLADGLSVGGALGVGEGEAELLCVSLGDTDCVGEPDPVEDSEPVPDCEPDEDIDAETDWLADADADCESLGVVLCDWEGERESVGDCEGVGEQTVLSAEMRTPPQREPGVVTVDVAQPSVELSCAIATPVWPSGTFWADLARGGGDGGGRTVEFVSLVR